MDANIIKSPNDKKLYRAFTLDNGLRVLLVSDQNQKDETDEVDELSEGSVISDHGSEDLDDCETPEEDNSTKKRTNLAAAALCINVGSFSDPDDLPGLAHFLEHMVFMGSEKYPEENEYESFISKHGGSDNASTDCEKTLYVMDVVPKHFKEALDLFANCFISPLLKRESMDREIEAVDSEFSLMLPNDSERQSHLLQSCAKHKHPMSKFMCGNLKSLKELPTEKNIDVNEELHRLYKTYYSSEHMTLVVQSIETLDTLEEWVREIFPLIPNRNTQAPTFDDLLDPFDMEKFNKLYKVVPVKDIQELKLTWVLPPSLKHYKSKPIRYIEFLVGHEGKGSIITYLRKKFLAVALQAGTCENGFDMNSTCSMFSIAIALTELGMDNLSAVISAVFQYIKMIVQEGPKKYIFDEIKAVTDMDFHFQEQEEPYNYVSQLAGNMQLFPCEEYLIGHKLFWEFDEKLIQDFMNHLVISKANISVFSSHYTEAMCPETELWTQCRYSCEDIPSEWVAEFDNVEVSADFHLPEPNRFIASNFDLKHTTSTNEYPYKILENEHMRLWFKEDVKFKVPKACIYFNIASPAVLSSALNNAMAELFIKIFLQVLCEEVYPGEIAHVYASLSLTAEGLSLACWGFNDKLPLLLEIALDRVSSFEIEKELFDTMKHQMNLNYYNKLLNPNKMCKFIRFQVTQNVYWSPVQKKNALQMITLEMLKDFVKVLFSGAFIEALAQGNVTKEEFISMSKMVVTKLGLQPLNKEDIPCLLSYKLPYGETYCKVTSFNKLNPNSVIANIFQFGAINVQEESNIELLVDLMNEPCFNQLRTQEQLGYSVNCLRTVSWNSLGFCISVSTQSSKFSCTHVNQRIEEFLKGFFLEFDDISEEKFQTQLSSLIENKKQVDLNLKEETDYNWYMIHLHSYLFDLKKKQITYFENLKLDEFKTWLKDAWPLDVNKRRKFGIQVVGPQDENLKSESSSMETDEVSESRSDSILTLNFLSTCAEESPAVYISSLEDFTKTLETFPKFNSDMENDIS